MSRRAQRLSFLHRALEIAPLIPYDYDVAQAHAELLAYTRRGGTPRGSLDLIIAATALATERTVVTLDRKGFEGLPGVSVWTPG